MKLPISFLALLTAATLAAQPADPATVRVVLKHPGQAAAALRPGIVFAPDVSPALAFDLYRPPPTAKDARWPVIVFLSGTNVAREWQWFKDLGTLAAAHGFAAVIPDKRYPRGWEGMLSGTADTKRVLEYLRAHAAELQIDPERMCLWSFSGGGRLAAVGASKDGFRPRVQVNFYGLLDLTDELAVIADETRRRELLAQYSPSHAWAALGAEAMPFFVARAGRDQPVINNSIDRLAAEALAQNLPLTLVNYPSGVHGFDGYQDTPESRRIIATAFEFVRAHLAP